MTIRENERLAVVETQIASMSAEVSVIRADVRALVLAQAQGSGIKIGRAGITAAIAMITTTLIATVALVINALRLAGLGL